MGVNIFGAQAKIERDAAEKLKAEQEAIAEQTRKDEAAKHVTQHDPVAEAGAVNVQNNPPQSEAGTPAGAQSEPAAPVAKPSNVVVIEHQDEIRAFLASRDFGKETGKVRAILVEFVKFSEQFGNRKTASGSL